MTDFDAYPSPPYRLSWRKVAVLAAVLALLAGTAWAQVQPTRPYCDKPDVAIKALADTFGERPAGLGVDTQDRLVSLYVDPDDGSWTLLMTVPGREPVSCVLSGGEGWESAKQVEGEPS